MVAVLANDHFRDAPVIMRTLPVLILFVPFSKTALLSSRQGPRVSRTAVTPVHRQRTATKAIKGRRALPHAAGLRVYLQCLPVGGVHVLLLIHALWLLLSVTWKHISQYLQGNERTKRKSAIASPAPP
jgi:hypothetical protein